MQTDVLIVGAGLSGLALARALSDAGRDFRIVEARARLGGRVQSHQLAGHIYDLGPAWFWPGQPRMAAVTRELGLTAFEQHTAGRLVFQDGAGAITRHIEMATMGGSLRIDGGLSRLIEGFADRIDPDRIHVSHEAFEITQAPDGLHTKIKTPTGLIGIDANHVVLALPPRLAAERIRFAPELPPAALSAMRGVPTWMAGHAKVLAIYDRPFWREAGLNGDAISQTGPLAEVHDASPMGASAGALFAFVSTPPSGRQDAQAFRAAALTHLVDLFGPDAAAPLDLVLQDWAFETFTAAAADHQPLASHPAYGKPQDLTELCDGRLHVASSEMGSAFGGFLEGALEAAEAVASELGS